MSAITDEGRRLSDIVTGHLTDSRENVGRWIAVRLSDGGTDGTVYAARADAVRHQNAPCGYVKLPPDGMPPAEASRWLLVQRMFHDAGFRLLDPDDRREPIMPYTNEDLAALVRQAKRGMA